MATIIMEEPFEAHITHVWLATCKWWKLGNFKPFLLKEVISLTSWEHLSIDQRSHLFEFLPQSFTDDQKNTTIRHLFAGDNVTAFSSSHLLNPSGNPVDELISKLKSGYYSKEACCLRKCQRKAVKAKAKYERSRYNHNLLKDVIVSRQCHLSAITFPQCFKVVQEKRDTKPVDDETRAKVEKSAENMYYRVLNDIKREVLSSNCLEDDVISSESDSDERAHHVASKFFPNATSHNRIKNMLVQHHRRRAANLQSPDLSVNGIKLNEVSNRAYGVAKRHAGLLRKRKRMDGSMYPKQKKMKPSGGEKETRKRSHGMKERGTITSPSCYFQLVRDVIRLTSDKTFDSIQLLISDWLASAEASRYDWTSNLANWKELVRSGLEFLSNRQVATNDGSPLLHYNEGSWLWNSSLGSDEEERILLDLCMEWLDKIADQLVAPTSSEGLNSFHSQEQRRFMYAHQAFVYNINGSRYPVPPVKGTVGPAKEGKVAREHCLLKSERPPQVTLLALTRDAVARLPQGRGTRTRVCSLLKDSQYLAPIVTDAQVNAAVSGALDRLHYETDPCVKYDASAKVWMYLHGERTPEELERIHTEQMGAPKRKRDRGLQKTKLKKSDARKKKGSNQKPPSIQADFDHVSRDEATSHPLPNETSTTVGDKPAPTCVGAATNKPIATRTIQVTHKQLLEMTQKLTEPATMGGAREVLLAQVDKKANPPAHVTNSTSAKLAQPGLKLILKPGGGEMVKPVAEFVKVVDTSSGRNPGNQQLLSADALRRLTEQLSAMSSRPIKIVQRNIAPPQSPSGSRVINITSRPGMKAPLTQPAAPLSASQSAVRSAKTVYISRVGEAVEEPRVLHIVHKNPKIAAKPQHLDAGSSNAPATND